MQILGSGPFHPGSYCPVEDQGHACDCQAEGKVAGRKELKELNRSNHKIID